MTHRSCVRTNLTYHTKIIIFLQIPKIKTNGSKPTAAKPYSNLRQRSCLLCLSGRSLAADTSSLFFLFFCIFICVFQILFLTLQQF